MDVQLFYHRYSFHYPEKRKSVIRMLETIQSEINKKEPDAEERCLKKKNAEHRTPLQLAAYLGESEIFTSIINGKVNPRVVPRVRTELLQSLAPVSVKVGDRARVCMFKECNDKEATSSYVYKKINPRISFRYYSLHN